MTLILSGTNGLSDVDGDASTPAVRGTDANSGIFFGADTVGVSTGGSEKVSVGASAVVVNDGGADVDFRVEGDTDANLVFVDASADKVGIGINAPSEKLTLSASSSSTYTSGLSSEANPIGTNVRIQNTSATTDTFAGITFNPVNGGSQGQLAYVGGISTGSGLGADIVFGGRAASGFYAERMRITSAGLVGIGATSPAGIFSVTTGTNIGAMFTRNANDDGTAASALNIATPGGTETRIGSSGPLTFVVGAVGTSAGLQTERMRIDSSGNLLVGTTSAGGDGITAYIRGSASGTTSFFNFDRANTTAIGTVLNFQNNSTTVGTVSHNNTSTTYATSSDYRLKENIAPMTGALAKVLELNPVTYTWKENGFAGEGFIAHELQAICPDAVTGEKDATEIQRVEVSPAVEATYDDDGNELTPAVEAVYEEREVPKYQGVDTSFLVATLTAAIQELSAKNDALEARIAALETGA